jgi:methylmalonyl-CoA mutase
MRRFMAGHPARLRPAKINERFWRERWSFRAGLAPMNRGMSRVPDFSKLPFAPARVQFEDVRAEPWLTPEGIGVAPVYRASDIAGLDCLDSFPGIAPYVRGPYPAMYVERPWTIRQYAGSTFRHIVVMIRIIRALPRTSAWPASRSIRFRAG